MNGDTRYCWRKEWKKVRKVREVGRNGDFTLVYKVILDSTTCSITWGVYNLCYTILHMTKISKNVSLQEDDVRSKIRTRYVKGWTILAILDDLGIQQGTYDANLWRNTHGFRDFMTELKKEYFLTVTEAVSREILQMDTTENAKMLTIKQKEAEFIRETLLKDHGYTKRVETLGLNINKNEPLDDEQRAKLDKLLNNNALSAVVETK